MISENIYDLFNLPLSMVDQAELDELQNEANEIIPSQSNDEWSFPWGSKFSTSKLYRVLIGDHIIPNPILDIWKTCVVPRQKFFSWLLLNGKLNSKEMMLKKKNYVEFSECILCDTNILESIVHLFFECSFSQSFWWALGFEWNTNLDINSMITDAKTRYPMPFLVEIIIKGCWSLWDQRNSAIFRDTEPCIHRGITKFKLDFALSMHRAQPSLKEGMQSWLDTL
jgi:hypothetical protein